MNNIVVLQKKIGDDYIRVTFETVDSEYVKVTENNASRITTKETAFNEFYQIALRNGEIIHFGEVW